MAADSFGGVGEINDGEIYVETQKVNQFLFGLKDTRMQNFVQIGRVVCE